MSWFRKPAVPSLIAVRVNTHFGSHIFQARTSVVSDGMLKLMDGDVLVACFAPGNWCSFYTTITENADA